MSVAASLASSLDEYLITLRVERGLARNTIAAYRRDLNQYLDFVGEAEPDPGVLDRFVTSLSESGLVKSTISRKIAAVRGFHRFMVAEGLRDSDPTLLLEAPRTRDSLPKALSIDEAIRLVQAPNLTTAKGRRDSAVLEFLYATGARVSETCGCDLTDVDLVDRLAKVTGKGSRQRIVPIGEKAVEAIRRWLGDRLDLVSRTQQGDPLFTSLRGNRLSRQAVFDIVRYSAESVGIRPEKVSPHVLRHSAATHMVEGGADLRTVQEILGHATISTTQVYTRVSSTHLMEIYVEAHPRSR